MLKKYFLLFFLPAVAGCTDKNPCDSNVDLSDVPLTFEFEDLTHELHQVNSREALKAFFKKHPIIRDDFFEFGGRPTENRVLADIAGLVRTPRVKALFEVRSAEEFESMLEKERSLRELLTHNYLKLNKRRSLSDVYQLISNSQVEDLIADEASAPKLLKAYLAANPKEQDFFYSIFAYRTDEQLLEDNYELLQNPFVDTLYQEIVNLIDIGQQSHELYLAYQRVKKLYPEFNVPKVQAVYSGFGKDLYISDSLLILGLDYYLGAAASYRPNVYDYFSIRLTPNHLVPQLLQITSLKFNKTGRGKKTILEEMIYYGKAMEFTRQMLPCVNDSLIIGYSHQQLANATVSEGVIWSHFIEKKLLYDDSPANITKYINERPNVPEIDLRCPGRIGQWLGWQIVRAYRAKTGVDFVELMKETDAQKILTQSKYRPRFR